MVDKILKKDILEKLIKPIFLDIGSGFTMRRPKGVQNIKGGDESNKFKVDYLKQGDDSLKNYLDVRLENLEKHDGKEQTNSNDVVTELKRDEDEYKILEEIKELLCTIKDNTKPESFKDKTLKRKEEESDDKAMQELISTLKEKEEGSNINLESSGSSSSILDGLMGDKNSKSKGGKHSKSKGGLFNKAKGLLGKGLGLLGAGAVEGGLGLGLGAGAVEGGLGLGGAMLGGLGSLAVANPITATILATGAVAYGGYKIWDSMRGDEEDKKVFDYLAEQGVIDHNIIGDSEVLNWDAVRALNEDTLEKLIGYDDFSDEDTDKLKNILSEKRENKKIKKNVDLKVKKDNDKKTVLLDDVKSIYGSDTNISEKIKKHKKELLLDKSIDFKNMSESEQRDMIVKKSLLEVNSRLESKPVKTKRVRDLLDYNKVSLNSDDSSKILKPKQVIDSGKGVGQKTITVKNKSDNINEDIKELILTLKKQSSNRSHNTQLPTAPTTKVVTVGQFKKIDDTTLLLVSNEE